MNLSFEEISILETYRRYGLGGLAEVAMKSYRDEQRELVCELNRKIEELEDRIEEMRDGPPTDWSDPVKYIKEMMI